MPTPPGRPRCPRTLRPASRGHVIFGGIRPKGMRYTVVSLVAQFQRYALV